MSAIAFRPPRRSFTFGHAVVGFLASQWPRCISNWSRKVPRTIEGSSLFEELFVLIVQLNLLGDDFVPRRRQRVVLCPFLKSIAHAPGCGF